jgi:hypothetical protein
MVSPEPISTIELAAGGPFGGYDLVWRERASRTRLLQAVRRGEHHDIRSDRLGAIELDAIAPAFGDHRRAPWQ